MWLTLDRGNSTLDVMLHGAAPRRARLAPEDSLRAWLGGLGGLRAVAQTVVPGGLDGPLRELDELGVPVRVVGRDLACPLTLAYETPQTLGADRWLGALAAHRCFGQSIVVDCGTATTVNFVDKAGVFHGGAIAPGLGALAQAMAQRTPHLPPPGSEPPVMPARSSAQNVRMGLLLTFCGGIERMVEDLLAQAQGRCALVLTGGHADDYEAAGRLAMTKSPDLVHQGLRILAEESVWKS